jgi:hypothetical protein
MWAVLGEPVGRIPRYTLVNKAGQIVVPDAPRPGTDALIAEINDLVKEK